MTPEAAPGPTPQQMVEVALAEAAGSDLLAAVSQSSQVNLRWAANDLTTNGFLREQTMDVVAFHSHRTGASTATVSGSVADTEDVRQLVARARAAAAAAAPNEDAAPLLDGGSSPDWHEPPGTTSPAVLKRIAPQLAGTFERAAVDGVEHFGYAEHEIATTYLGMTSGTRLRHAQPQTRLEMTAKSRQRTRSAWIGSADPEFRHLDLAGLDAELRRSLARQRKRIPVEPGRHRVLLSPSATADLMIDLYWSADARSAVEGRSAFAARDGRTRVAERLTDVPVTLSSDPADPMPGMSCAPYAMCVQPEDSCSPFDSGAPVSATDWISDGRLENLIGTRHTAGLAKIPFTPWVDNLRFEHANGSGTVDEVAQRLGDGLLITCLWYNRMVDPATLLLTGLTRDGVYVVRGGEVIGTSGNFRFNDSPLGMLGRIVDAGSPVRTLAREMGDYFNRAAMPPLVVEDFNLSTASEAL